MTENKVLFSIVSPVYGAEKTVPELVRRIIEEVSKITDSFEIVLVEDGCPDKSWEAIEQCCKNDNRIKGIKLSRNFGQQYAITAGLMESNADWVVVIDCDLQDNPKYIPDMYKKALEGYDIVFTSKEKRKHSLLRDILSGLFFIVFNYLAESTAKGDVGSFTLLSRKVVNAYCRIGDTHRHYLLILRMLGFNSTFIKIVHDQRHEGKSSYNFAKLLKHAIDGITSQSDKLLRLSIGLGFIFFVISLLWALMLIIYYFKIGAQPGYTSIMVLILLSTGLVLISIGVAGIYIGKIFEEVKKRPLYFIDKKINC